MILVSSRDIMQSIEMNVPDSLDGHSNHTGSNLTGTWQHDITPSG